jgi:hypothetical protein
MVSPLPILLVLANYSLAQTVWPEKLLAPYVDVVVTNPRINIAKKAAKTGIKFWTVGPIIADVKGDPSFGGTIPLGEKYYLSTIQELREKQQGDVILFFGGSGLELAHKSATVEELVMKYKTTIEMYSAKYMTVAIEGVTRDQDPATVTRRCSALAQLQTELQELKISLSLPTYVSGLDTSSLNILKACASAGVNLSSINLIASNFGSLGAPNGTDMMGTYVVSSLRGSRTLLGKEVSKYAQTPLGIIPMIGKNDVEGEFFKLDDAEELVGYLNTTSSIRTVAYHGFNRFNIPNLRDRKEVSMVEQDELGFARTFKTWAGIQQPNDLTPDAGYRLLNSFPLTILVLLFVI